MRPPVVLKRRAISRFIPNFRTSEFLGISIDPVASHKKFAEKYNLPFTLLSIEREKSSRKKCGVWKEKSMYGKKYMGIERTTLLLMKTENSKYLSKSESYRHIEEVMKTLRKIDDFSNCREIFSSSSSFI